MFKIIAFFCLFSLAYSTNENLLQNLLNNPNSRLQQGNCQSTLQQLQNQNENLQINWEQILSGNWYVRASYGNYLGQGLGLVSKQTCSLLQLLQQGNQQGNQQLGQQNQGNQQQGNWQHQQNNENQQQQNQGNQQQGNWQHQQNNENQQQQNQGNQQQGNWQQQHNQRNQHQQNQGNQQQGNWQQHHNQRNQQQNQQQGNQQNQILLTYIQQLQKGSQLEVVNGLINPNQVQGSQLLVQWQNLQGLNNLQLPTSILNTDNENYAVVYSCLQVGQNKLELALGLTRQLQQGQNDAEILSALTNAGLDLSEVTLQLNNNCPNQWPPQL